MGGGGGGQNVLNLTEEVCSVSDIRLKLRDLSSGLSGLMKWSASAEIFSVGQSLAETIGRPGGGGVFGFCVS